MKTYTTRQCNNPTHSMMPHHHREGSPVGEYVKHRHPGCPFDCGGVVYLKSVPVTEEPQSTVTKEDLFNPSAVGLKDPQFERELQSLLNRYSIDAACGTPDFILVEYICSNLEALRRTAYRKHMLSRGSTS